MKAHRKELCKPVMAEQICHFFENKSQAFLPSARVTIIVVPSGATLLMEKEQTT
jgi:hypothetical protein